MESWNQQTTTVALGLAAAALVMSVTLAVQRWLHAGDIRRAEKAGDEERLMEIAAATTRRGGLSTFFAGLLRPAPASDDYRDLSILLSYAGQRGTEAMDRYLARRVYLLFIVIVLVTLVIILLGQNGILFAPILLGGAFLGPKILLRAEAAGRQERIELAIPSTLDLLEACIEAGLGLEQALGRVAAEMGSGCPDIADELAVLVGELRAGLPPAEAFRKLSARVEVDEVKTLCSVLIQSANLGAPLSNTLKQYSLTARKRRGLFLEERAGRVTAAMTLPLTLCLLPSALLVVMGPAIIAVLESFSG
jgi:tight adherence protein C